MLLRNQRVLNFPIEFNPPKFSSKGRALGFPKKLQSSTIGGPPKNVFQRALFSAPDLNTLAWSILGEYEENLDCI